MDNAVAVVDKPPTDGIHHQKTVSTRGQQLTKTKRVSATKPDLTETPEDKVRDDLHNWGLGLIGLGIVHFVFSNFLNPVWGVVIVVIGAINLVFPLRGMFIVNGLVLFVAGLMNISSVTAYEGWGKFGLFQLGWGILEMRKYWMDDFSD
jgi:hypothetical protein